MYLTHHMTSCVNSGKREAVRTACLSSHLTIDAPRAQWDRRKVLLTVPIKRESPRLISDPVADPVICPDINKHTDPTLEQGANVVRRTVQLVSGCIERLSDGSRAGGELLGNMPVDTERRAYI